MDLQDFLLVVPVLLGSVIAHEIAHGYAALKQGDPTAKELGRLSWNPVKHIDPFLTVIMPLLIYFGTNGQAALGGAKPVPVNPANYRNRVRGDIIVSLAGVTVNLLLAFASAALIALLGGLARVLPAIESGVGIAQALFNEGIKINLLLLMFNLIPIPPLDGSHVAKYLLPPALAVQYQRLGFLGLILIIVIMNMAPGFLSWWFGPAQYTYTSLLSAVRGFLTPTFYQWAT